MRSPATGAPYMNRCKAKGKAVKLKWKQQEQHLELMPCSDKHTDTGLHTEIGFQPSGDATNHYMLIGTCQSWQRRCKANDTSMKCIGCGLMHLCGVGASRLSNSGEVLEDVAPSPALVHHVIHHVCRHHNLLLHHVCKGQCGTTGVPAINAGP